MRSASRIAAGTYAEGNKINGRDGVRAMRCIVKYGLLVRR